MSPLRRAPVARRGIVTDPKGRRRTGNRHLAVMTARPTPGMNPAASQDPFSGLAGFLR